MKNTITSVLSLSTFLFVFLMNQTTLLAGCQAQFSYQQDVHSQNVNFTDLSTSSNTVAVWIWNFGDGTILNDQNPSHVYGTVDTYNVCLTIQDTLGCSSTTCHHFAVHAALPCQASFVTNVTGPNTYFLNTSTGLIQSTQFSWDFGDKSTSFEQNPIHTYAPGTYNACLTISDALGCSSTTCQYITIHGSSTCLASFTYLIDPVSSEHLFTNTSTGTSITTKYSWDFGDGNTSTDENPHYNYVHPGNYIVCLTIGDHSNGCASHICQPVNFTHTDNHFRTLQGESLLIAQSETDNFLNNKVQNITVNPNPFNSQSVIQYELVDNATITIGIYNFMGNRINLVVNENELKGLHTHVINSENLNSGSYFIKLQAGEEAIAKRITVIK